MTTKYNNGKIYKITNSINDYIYIGSTHRTLNERLIFFIFIIHN